jgi:hypothetical protein
MKMNTSSCLPSGLIKGINLHWYCTARESREGGSSAWQGGRKGPALRREQNYLRRFRLTYSIDMAGSKITLLCLALVAFGAQAQHFPPLDQDNPPKSRTINPVGGYTFCMTAHREIPANSTQPLFTFNFAPPGASGVALIDGKTVHAFHNEQHLLIRARVSAGDHRFVLHVDRPAENTFMSSNDDFKYCRPK